MVSQLQAIINISKHGRTLCNLSPFLTQFFSRVSHVRAGGEFQLRRVSFAVQCTEGVRADYLLNNGRQMV